MINHAEIKKCDYIKDTLFITLYIRYEIFAIMWEENATYKSGK